jgi:hypothetical protein
MVGKEASDGWEGGDVNGEGGGRWRGGRRPEAAIVGLPIGHRAVRRTERDGYGHTCGMLLFFFTWDAVVVTLPGMGSILLE